MGLNCIHRYVWDYWHCNCINCIVSTIRVNKDEYINPFRGGKIEHMP